MPITIARNTLLSAAARAQVGTRRLNLSNSITRSGGESGLGGGNGILNFARRLVGFISRVIRFVAISVSEIWGWIVERTTALAQFNWNASDQQMIGGMRARNLAVAGAWGTVAGSALGWTTSIVLGVGVSMVVPVIGGAALAKLMAANVAQEALQEVSATLVNALRTTLNATASNLSVTAYIKFRRWVKSQPRALLRGIFGERFGDAVKDQWGAEGAPAFTIAGQIEEAIERIPNEFIRTFVENAADEFFDSLVEGGFIVAQQLDEAILQARAGTNQALGDERTVIITPDRQSPNETYQLTGKQELIKPQIQETINSHRNLYGKDVGEIVGQPALDWFRAVPMRRQMVILFYSKERPPWRQSNGQRVKSATYTIPDPKAGLSWRQIKAAASVYDWGKFRATANLNNGRQMAVYGGSAREAERKLRQLLELSTAEITTLSVAEEKDRNPNIRKDQTRMYPAFVTFTVRRPTVDGQGRFIGDREWDADTKRYPLWVEQAPRDFVPLAGAGN